MNTEHVSPVEMEIDLRESIRMCMQEQDFEGYAEKMKQARSLFFDPRQTLMPFLSQLPADQASEILEETHRRFAKGADESRYGLINAVTSLAPRHSQSRIALVAGDDWRSVNRYIRSDSLRRGFWRARSCALTNSNTNTRPKYQSRAVDFTCS